MDASVTVVCGPDRRSSSSSSEVDPVGLEELSTEKRFDRIIDPDDTTGRWSLVAFTCAGAASISVPATETEKANSFFSGMLFG